MNIINIEAACERIITQVCDEQGLSVSEKEARSAALRAGAAAYLRERMSGLMVESANLDRQGFPVSLTPMGLLPILSKLRADVKAWIETQP